MGVGVLHMVSSQVARSCGAVLFDSDKRNPFTVTKPIRSWNYVYMQTI